MDSGKSNVRILRKITKHKITVEIELDGGRHLVGYMFSKSKGRLTDMMYYERVFLPFLS